MIKKICSVLIVILLLVAVFACYMYSKANDYRVEISNLTKENKLSSAQFEEQILAYEKEISELNIYLDSVEESLKEVNMSYQDIQNQGYFLSLSDGYFGMYEDYIEFLIKLDSNADAVLETCILPKYLRVNDEVAGLTVRNFIVTPLIDESRVYDGHHIEFDGEIVVEGILGYNDYYGSYEILVRDLEQIPHLPRDREMHILIVNDMAFAEMLSFEVGEELVFVISKLTLAYDLSKPTMNSATVIEVSKKVN